jgi:NAD(P)-dependent dehydrogenase (short-subunit alcohol dehydrogenase family)
MMGRLTGQVALIAGGPEGVGRGIAQRFENEGATIVMIEPDQARADIDKAVQQAVETFGRIDILVNAVEHDSAATMLDQLEDEHLAHTLARQFHGPLWTMRAALPTMKKQGSGHILNIVSAYGDSTWRGLGDYNVASEAVKALTRTAAEEWGPHGILVNAILPAADTPAYQRHRARQPERADQLVKGSALGRMGDPVRDIGGAAMFLVSESGRFITGHMVYADGGQHLTPSPYEALIAAD